MTRVKFVESKSVDISRVDALLDACRARNEWANQGPLYEALKIAYSEYLGLGAQQEITPCANGGIALEAMARLLASREGRKLRWVVSAFSFQNLGRGYFSNVTFVDCTDEGLLDLDAVKALSPESYDGLVVVNPLGHGRDFGRYTRFARETGKKLLIDNAAGLGEHIPDWHWQSFSLHHTKPFGMGEGGLALTPADASEELYALLNYGQVPSDPGAWLNNGKISDIACAFHIDRLEKFAVWMPRYREQAERIHQIATALGLKTVLPFDQSVPAMSWAFRTPVPVPLHRVARSESLVFAKYYKPLKEMSQTVDLYESIINIPTHPDMAAISDQRISDEISALMSGR
jgi:dTDP-4-amino-4,6-dideoxygalactose transaminase